MPVPETSIEKRLFRWISPSEQPKPIDLDHPVLEDIAAAFDELQQARGRNTMGSVRKLSERNLKLLLVRALRVADSEFYRDYAGLSLKAHPLWDEIREALKGE